MCFGTSWVNCRPCLWSIRDVLWRLHGWYAHLRLLWAKEILEIAPLVKSWHFHQRYLPSTWEWEPLDGGLLPGHFWMNASGHPQLLRRFGGACYSVVAPFAMPCFPARQTEDDANLTLGKPLTSTWPMSTLISDLGGFPLRGFELKWSLVATLREGLCHWLRRRGMSLSGITKFLNQSGHVNSCVQWPSKPLTLSISPVWVHTSKRPTSSANKKQRNT